MVPVAMGAIPAAGLPVFQTIVALPGASRPCRGSASRRALTVGSSGARLTNAQATFL